MGIQLVDDLKSQIKDSKSSKSFRSRSSFLDTEAYYISIANFVLFSLLIICAVSVICGCRMIRKYASAEHDKLEEKEKSADSCHYDEETPFNLDDFKYESFNIMNERTW